MKTVGGETAERSRPEGPKIESEIAGVGFPGRGQQSPSHQLGVWERAVSSRQRGSGQSPNHPKAIRYFHQSG